MKKMRKIALFCMALTAATVFSVACNFDIDINVNNSSSSKYETSTSSLSSKNESSSMKDENSSTTKEESSSNVKDENSSTSKDENSSSTNNENSSSTSKDENSSSTSSSENSSNSSSSSAEDSSSSSSSSSTEDSSNDSSSDNSSAEDSEYPDTYPEDGNCVFGDWELFREADCDTEGVKVRYCTVHGDEHADYESFVARGHDFGTTGICETCQEEATIPAPGQNATYINPADENSGIIGSGHDYPQYREVGVDEVEIIPNTGRYEFSVDGYYQIEIGNEGTCWFEFAVPAAGQYAVISTSNANDVSIEQYASSVATLYPIGTGRTLTDGNFISVANCADMYFNAEWRATFCLTGSAGDMVKFYIVKIGDPAWQPEYITIDVGATQIKGKAPEGAEGTTATDVPYESSYFYDETSGFYRMGTKENPGEIIYVAITNNATRLMGEMSFVGLPEAGASLNLDGGKSVEGNYIKYNYAPFMYSDTTYGGTANSYQAFVNSDGMYPVTKELYEFLKLYVTNNTIATPPEEGNEDNGWLAACYYYKLLPLGSEGNPIKINQFDTYTATQYDVNQQIYYTFSYNPNPDATGVVTTYCTLTCATQNVSIWIGNTRYSTQNGTITIPFQTDSAQGITFCLMARVAEIVPMEFTISLLEGSSDYPIEIKTLGEVALTPIQIRMLSGESNYEAYYSYTATEAGTLTLTTTSTAQILLGENTNVINGSASVSVAAGETVTIYVRATSTTPVNVNITFTAAS